MDTDQTYPDGCPFYVQSDCHAACELLIRVLYGPRREKTCLRWFANNKGSDQSVHTRSLISAFIIRLL